MYSIENYASFNPATECWLPMAFHDAALLHAILACPDAWDALSTGLKERPTAVMLLREAIRIVSERLQAASPSTLSNATVVVIATLAIMEVNIPTPFLHMPCYTMKSNTLRVEN